MDNANDRFRIAERPFGECLDTQDTVDVDATCLFERSPYLIISDSKKMVKL